ncbi:MAG: exonuclease SbcCD subunit D, partial [Thermomicrobiales bacterium]
MSYGSTRPIRIAHLADTHLGYSAFSKVHPESGRNQRAVDIEQSFQAAVSDILSREVDLVLHAGDVFHHTRPSWSTMTHFLVQMRRFESAGIPVVVIAGNHDTPRMRVTGSVYDFLKHALPDIRFMAGYDTDALVLAELDLVVHGVPHGALTNPDPPMLMPDSHLRNVVMTHGVAGGALFTGGHEPGEVEIKGNILQ